MIVTSNLSKSFKDFLAVDNVSLQVNAGEVLALLGPNGAGKTTTIRMLTTVLKPTSGTATVAGFDVLAKKNQTGGRPSLGLVGMQERATLLNGTFFVASIPGQGTLVEVTVPYQQDETEVKDENTPSTGG
jgi:ABC-type Na+ transport system ATPase subunit NatA